MSTKLKGPDGRIPDRLSDGRPAVSWERRWTEGSLPLWVVATTGGIAVIFVLGLIVLGLLLTPLVRVFRKAPPLLSKIREEQEISRSQENK